MSIGVDTNLAFHTEPAVKEICYSLVGILFRLHNEYGRLFNERVYKYGLKEECHRLGIDARLAVLIHVSHLSFRKTYFVDLLVEGGIPFELKSAETLHPSHRSQLLHYILLMGVTRGKLINVGAERVQDKYVSTKLTPEGRKQIRITETEWRPNSDRAEFLREQLLNLLRDWGAFLDVRLYAGAINHFLGDQSGIWSEIPVMRQGTGVYTPKVSRLRPTNLFSHHSTTS